MRVLLSLIVSFGVWMATLLAVQAQEDDKGFLTRAIQDALSGAGREVRIDGFQGALSSSASFDQMTIADATGVWLTLRNVELVWTRSALLRGRLEVESLTADQLDIPRLPLADAGALPAAEAAPFRLPSLPVSIDITAFDVRKINLGAPLLGEAAQLRVSASASYSEAVANVDIQARRTDAKQGVFAIRANLERSTDVLDLLIQLNEGAGGMAARVLDVPGLPSVTMSVKGAGPLDEFTTDVRIATDGQERLAGRVTLGTQAPRRPSDPPDQRIQAQIGGDITALVAPRYRAFFGTDMQLSLDARRTADGALDVNTFALRTQAASLQGQMGLDADRWPSLIDITGVIATPDATPVLLPLSQDATTAERVDLRIRFDAAEGDALNATFDLRDLRTTGASVERTRLVLDGTLTRQRGSAGQFAGTLGFDAEGLVLEDEALGMAIGPRITGSAVIAYAQDTPITIKAFAVQGVDYGLGGNLNIDGLETGFATELDLALNTQNLARFSALAGQDLGGQSQVSIKGNLVPLSGQFDLAVDGAADDLSLGIAQVDAALVGRTTLNLTAARNATGTVLRDLVLDNPALNLTGEAALRSAGSRASLTAQMRDLSVVLPQYDGPIHVTATAAQGADGWTLDARTQGPYRAELTARGLATGANASLVFTADVPDISRFADQIGGRVQADGRLWRTEDTWQIAAQALGPHRVTATIEGAVAPALNIGFDLSAPDVQPFAPQIRGPLEATGQVRQTGEGFFVDADAQGPYGSRAQVSGLATGADMRMTFDVAVPDVAPLVPGVSGPLAAKGVLRQTPQGIVMDADATGPYAARASVQGVVTGQQPAVVFSVAVPDIGAVVDKVNGPLEVTGNARRQGADWRVNTLAAGPSGTQATIGGVIRGDGTVDIALKGSAPLGLSRPFIAPRSLQGQARFDLSIIGPPALSSVTGTIQMTEATLAAPNLRLSLRNIAADIRLARNRAQIDVTGQATNGGELRIGGAVTLTPSLPADIQVGLRDLVLIDPRLYRTSLDGDLRLAGPLTGGAVIAGQINVGETEVSVPSTGLTSIGDIPQITHVGASSIVSATRRKAGLDNGHAGAEPTAAGPVFGLNMKISAPGRLFVRGRGLDAELGGALQLTGDTGGIVSVGRFDLLRGRLDILGKRFDLVEGSSSFQGDTVPYIRFVSETTTSTGEVRVIVEGPADAPAVSFAATPEAPQDEVLAQLLFGRRISDISAFQALQLANAVATLAGREGAGVISNLRDGFGLDDLDVTTTDTGATAVSVGKYLSDNIYTDVTAASDGTGEVSLNLDITPNLKGKATLDAGGDSGIGLFFEKDY